MCRAHQRHAQVGADGNGGHVLGKMLAKSNYRIEAIGNDVGEVPVDRYLDRYFRIGREETSYCRQDGLGDMAR